jgi:hypothetical protein
MNDLEYLKRFSPKMAISKKILAAIPARQFLWG